MKTNYNHYKSNIYHQNIKDSPHLLTTKKMLSLSIYLVLFGQALPSISFAAGCANPMTKVYLAGTEDNFASSPVDPLPNTTGFTLLSFQSFANFDQNTSNRYVVHLFDNLSIPGYTIVDVGFEVKAKPNQVAGFNPKGTTSSAGNDSVFLQSSTIGSSTGGKIIGAVFGDNPVNSTGNSLFSGAWGTDNPNIPSSGMVFSSPNSFPNWTSTITTNLVSELNTNGEIFALAQDDTSIDYFKLTVDYCPTTPPEPPKPQVLTEGGNQWLMTSYQDSSPNHNPLSKQAICFQYQGTTGTHDVYSWYSPTLAGWKGWARVEGDQVFMHGNYLNDSASQEQNTALQWEVATEINNPKRPTSGWGHCVDWEGNTKGGVTNMFANVKFQRTGKQCKQIALDDVLISEKQPRYACTSKRETPETDLDKPPVIPFKPAKPVISDPVKPVISDPARPVKPVTNKLVK